MPTAKHIWADVGRAPSLVFQQVIFTHQVLSKTEVCYGYSMSPAENQKASVNKDLHEPNSTEEADQNRGVSVGLLGKLEVQGKDKQSC